MSFKLENKVWETDILSPAAKLVLLWLAKRADDDGRNCFPQIETIAKACGLTYRGVTKSLKELEKVGHITIKSGRGRHRSNDYFVHPDTSAKWERRSYFKRGENGNNSTGKWEPDDNKIGTKRQENGNVVPTYTSVNINQTSLITTAPIESAVASSLFALDVEVDNELSSPKLASEKKKKDQAAKKKKELEPKRTRQPQPIDDDYLAKLQNDYPHAKVRNEFNACTKWWLEKRQSYPSRQALAKWIAKVQPPPTASAELMRSGGGDKCTPL